MSPGMIDFPIERSNQTDNGILRIDSLTETVPPAVLDDRLDKTAVTLLQWAAITNRGQRRTLTLWLSQIADGRAPGASFPIPDRSTAKCGTGANASATRRSVCLGRRGRNITTPARSKAVAVMCRR